MTLGIACTDFQNPADITRAEEIVKSLGMQEVEGVLGAPFVLKKEWPDLNPLGSQDCNARSSCRGCDRLTVSASGLVYTILDTKQTSALGAVCSTSQKAQPFRPVFFVQSVPKPE